MATEYTLEFLARQNAQILAALADMRDNNVVVTGMLARIEARMVALETRMASFSAGALGTKTKYGHCDWTRWPVMPRDELGHSPSRRNRRR
jgi:hypothetical protein